MGFGDAVIAVVAVAAAATAVVLPVTAAVAVKGAIIVAAVSVVFLRLGDVIDDVVARIVQIVTTVGSRLSITNVIDEP